MKKKLIKIVALCLALVTALSLSGCKGKSKKLTVIIGGGSPVEYSIDLKKIDRNGGLVAALEYLKEKSKLDYEITGGVLTKVGHLKANSAESKSICVYTSVEADMDKSADRLTVDYKGKTYVASEKSIYSMTLEEGAVIYIGYIRVL